MKPNTQNWEKSKVNLVANIVNSHFLDSDYQGKDWETVRKSLIEKLTSLLSHQEQEVKKEILGEIEKIIDGGIEKYGCSSWDNVLWHIKEDLKQFLTQPKI